MLIYECIFIYTNSSSEIDQQCRNQIYQSCVCYIPIIHVETEHGWRFRMFFAVHHGILALHKLIMKTDAAFTKTRRYIIHSRAISNEFT